MAKDSLKSLLENQTPINNLSQDIDSFTNLCAEMKMNDKDAAELMSLFKNYTSALIDNIDRRFGDSSEVLAAFSILNPHSIPQASAELKDYGNPQLEILSNHFFKENQEKSDRLECQWHGLKYYIRDVIKPNIPEATKLAGEKKMTASPTT